MSSAAGERQLVVFSLHGEDYGMPITSVREITHYARPGATAAAQGLIRGMISWRGSVLPVADLSARLGHSLDVGENTRILVLELAGGSLGLIVDAIVGVFSVSEAQISQLPTAAGNDLGGEIAAVGERLIVLIDPEAALGSALPQKPPPRRRSSASATPRKQPVRRTRRGSDSRPPAR